MSMFLALTAVAFVLALAFALSNAKANGGLAPAELWNAALFAVVCGLVVWLFVLDGQTKPPVNNSPTNRPPGMNPPSPHPPQANSASPSNPSPNSNWWASP